MDVNTNDGYLCKKRGQTGIEKKLMETGTEPGVVLPGAKECLEPPEAGRRKEGVFLRPAVEVALLTPWLQTSSSRTVGE